jgi:Sodium:neurotransmitter symporter family
MVMITLIGMPLLFMEFSFGQYFGVGSLTVFKKVCPIFQGNHFIVEIILTQIKRLSRDFSEEKKQLNSDHNAAHHFSEI